MVTLVNRLDRVDRLRETLLKNKEALIKAAILDCAFTYRESAMEVNTVQDRLAGFPQMAETFASRRPMAGLGI